MRSAQKNRSRDASLHRGFSRISDVAAATLPEERRGGEPPCYFFLAFRLAAFFFFFGAAFFAALFDAAALARFRFTAMSINPLCRRNARDSM